MAGNMAYISQIAEFLFFSWGWNTPGPWARPYYQRYQVPGGLYVTNGSVLWFEGRER